MADAFEGASVQEQLIEACRRNNVDLLTEIINDCKSDKEITDLVNNTTTVTGNHLYHEAALHGNYDIIDVLLDQPDFECDPISRTEGDTPLHSAIRWINSEPPAQREFGNALVEMMLEAGSDTRVRNKARLTPYQLVDPQNAGLRELIQRHEAAQHSQNNTGVEGQLVPSADDDDDDAEFSGSDDEERAEWERNRKNKDKAKKAR
ncbi:ankyrin repeat protein [Xylariaceae sp. FL0594]|nr:ankyrin repeat protein [Xylariaceae sp. FL0594]